MKNKLKNNRREAHQSKKMMWLIVLIGVVFLFLPMVSAWDFDNVLSYEKVGRYGKATITNAFGMGDKLAEITLTDNTEACVECSANGITTLYDKGKLIQDLRFIGKVNNYKILLKTGEKTEDIPNVIGQCSGIGVDAVCKNVIIGTHKETKPIYEEYKFQDLNAGIYYWRIEGIKKANARVDWIGTWEGFEIGDWALWGQSNSQVAYWDFNEGSGTVYDSIKNNPATPSGTATWSGAGKIGSAIYTPGSTGNYWSAPTLHPTYNFTKTNNVSISAWIYMKSISVGASDSFVAKYGSPDCEYMIRKESAAEKFNFGICDDTSGSPTWKSTTGTTIPVVNTWYHLVATKNDTGLGLWVNGIEEGYLADTSTIFYTDQVIKFGDTNVGESYPADVIIDEVGIWNKTLTASEIAELYSYAATTTLLSPADNSIKGSLAKSPVNLNVSVDFSAQHFAVNYNLTNVTYYIYNADGSTNITANTTTFTATATTNVTNMTFNLSLGSWKWNVYVCAKNPTITTCSFPYYNYSLDTSPVDFIENSQTFNSETTSGNKETFILNLTYNNTYYQSILGNIVYNGISYSGSKTGSGSNILMTSLIAVPSVSTSQKYGFYWEILVLNETGSYYSNSSWQNQTVTNIALDDCTTYKELILNYTLRDQKTQLVINGTIFNSSIELDLQLYSNSTGIVPVLNYSRLFNSTNYQPKICMQNLTNMSHYRLYTQMRYVADTYVPQFHYYQNFTLTNSTAILPQQINLYELKTSESQEFKITAKDTSFAVIKNAIINIQRKYISEGVFKSVEMAKTDNSGISTGHFDLNNVIYKIDVLRDGQLITTFDNIAIYCSDRLTPNCELNLAASAGSISPFDYYTYSNLLYALEFNQSTRTVKLSYSTADGTTAIVGINVTVFDNYFNNTICAKTLTSSAGQITCFISTDYKNITFVVEIWKDGAIVSDYSIYSIIAGHKEEFSGSIVVLLLCLMMTFPFFFIPHPIGMVLGAILGIILCAILFGIAGAWIGAGSSIIWIILAGGILIWRLQQD